MSDIKDTAYLSYMEELLAKTRFKSRPGPVVTVSREYGCPGIPFCEKLTSALSREFHAEWRFFDRQILGQASERLKIAPELVERLSLEKPRSILGQMMESIGGTYIPHDIRAKRAIAQIIRAVADEGHAVILGRGGVILTRDMQASLHIHLHASAAWRVPRVRELDHFKTDQEALQKMQIVDRERIYLRNFYAGEETDDNLFDLSFNCEFLAVDEIVHLTLEAARLKKLVG